MMTFEELGVSKALTAVLNKRNITAPTPIQQRAYQPVTKGTDVIGCSSTGSGKTLAYLLPVIATMQPYMILMRAAWLHTEKKAYYSLIKMDMQTFRQD